MCRLTLLFIVGSIQCTNIITFVNNCSDSVQVVRQPSGNAPDVEQAILAPGQTTSADFTYEDNVFKNGFDGFTQAHIYTKVMYIELYRISVANGFDTPMQIATDQDEALVITCNAASCKPEDTNAAAKQGSNFTLTFCPTPSK